MAGQRSNYQTSSPSCPVNDPPNLGSPRPLVHSLVQDGIYTSFYLSVSEPLMYMGSLTLLCMLDFCMYEIKFDFLLLIYLMSI